MASAESYNKPPANAGADHAGDATAVDGARADASVRTDESDGAEVNSADAANSADATNATNSVDTKNSADALNEYRFSFRGRTGEYFKIWLMNVILSIVTLGIYSAWAKVRDRRYFYTHTFLDDANFEYHARPISILIARILMLFIFTIAGIILSPQGYGDEAGYLSLLFLFLFLPWAWVRGLSFNARNSSYGNVRFKFNRAYFVPYLIYFLIITLIGWLIMPFLLRSYHKFKACNHQLGNLRFTFRPPPIISYVIVYGALVVAAICLLAALSFVIANPTAESYIGGTIVLALLSGYLFAWSLAKLFILFWQNVQTAEGAEGIVVRCAFTPHALAKILLVNYVAMFLTLSLATPWARIRKTRFLANHMYISAPAAALQSIIGRREHDESAFGEELDASEGFDFDVGII